MKTLVKIVLQMKQVVILQLFTVYTRYLIGCAFVIAAIGMGKIDGLDSPLKRMLTTVENNNIANAFRSFMSSDFYWGFIGWTQIIAGVLLLTQKFARLGAVIFFPVITNIFVITYAYDFHGTVIITGLMFLATLYLIVWELDSLQYIIIDSPAEGFSPRAPLKAGDLKLWPIAGLLMLATIVTVYFLKINLPFSMLGCLGIGGIAFIIYLAGVIRKAGTRKPA